MGIKINASRKTTIILLVVLFLIVGGTGGYLLWRVNQEDTVAPIDSEAGGYYAPCDSKGGKCGTNCICYWAQSMATMCGKPLCQCTQGSECPACEYPAVAYCRTGLCECKNYPGNGCSNGDYNCSPPKCPSGYQEISNGPGSSRCNLTDPTKNTAEYCHTRCDSKCSGCNNAFFKTRDCKKIANTCGDGVKADSEQCDPPNSTCTTASGEKGICSFDCTCPEQLPANPMWDIKKVSTQECIDDGTENPVSRVSNSITITNKNTTAGAVGKISSITDTLDPKVIPSTITNISHNGVLLEGASIGGSFIVKAVISWDLRSPLAEFNPGESKTFTYRYTVAKDVFGIYDNSVIATPSDDPDNVLRAATSIDARCNVLNSSCGDGKIDAGEECDPGTPGVVCTNGQTCTSDCKCPAPQPDIPEPPVEVPETGLFDESENIVILGAILLFLGLAWTWLNRTYEIINGELVERNKERFERKVVKN